MAGTHSSSILKREYPQYAYVLAIFSGGIAFIVPQLGVPVAIWLSYAFLALLFGSIWPDRALQWGGWLSLPIVLLIWVDVIVTGSIGGLLGNGIILGKALLSASLGAYVGSKLSVRKLANRSANIHVNRKRLNRSGQSARSDLILKELAPPIATIKTISSGHSTGRSIQAIEPTTHFHSLDAPLIKAAHEGALDKIRLLVADGADVNALSSDQWTPLTVAAGGLDDAVVKTLFGQGAPPDYSGERGWTALMIATIEGHSEAVRALLGHGAQINAENSKGWTALRFAVSMDETDILRVLLDAGADADIADHEGKTALMQAAAENIKKSLKVLLDAGADLRLKDHNEQTALMIAQKQGHAEIIKLLREAEAKATADVETPAQILNDDNSKIIDKTHRVIKVRRDQYYGLIDRYDVVPIGDVLPHGCEETGREGNEEECRDYAWRNSIGEPSELGWWLSFSR